MGNKIVFMFSGQGSQSYHMGAELYEKNDVFRYWFNKLDRIYYSNTGNSILNEVYGKDNKGKVFSELIYTHAAIFIVEYALAQTFIAEGVIPDYVFGSSIGEVTAAAIAEIIPYEEALVSLIVQSQLLNKYSEKGKMVSILERQDIYTEMAILKDYSEVVGINTDKNFTIACDGKKWILIEKELKKKKLLYYVLPVQYAFHSRYIDQIEVYYKKYLACNKYERPTIPFISSVSGKIEGYLYEGYFWDVIRKPIIFSKTLLNFVENEQNLIFIDLGPAGTLANIAKYNIKQRQDIDLCAIMTSFNIKGANFNSMLENIKVKIS